jgi:hypothetical protein
MIDVNKQQEIAKKIAEEARQEIAEEAAKKAKDALKNKYRALASAEAVVKNIRREIEDLEASVADGSFAG